MKRATSVEDHKLTAAYEGLRKVFAAPKFAERKDKPLAFWALPGDRRLPMALLGRSLNEILSRSLGELSATPGIGKKKVGFARQIIESRHEGPTAGRDVVR